MTLEQLKELKSYPWRQGDELKIKEFASLEIKRSITKYSKKTGKPIYSYYGCVTFDFGLLKNKTTTWNFRSFQKLKQRAITEYEIRNNYMKEKAYGTNLFTGEEK